jgi:O-antigen/teichoic acid export membrane protein
LVATLSLFTISLSAAIFTPMSMAFISSQKSLKEIYEKSFRYALILILPFAVGTMLLANQIILLIYGDAYMNSVGALQILIWSGTLFFLNSIFFTTLGSINKQNFTSIVMGIGVAVNVFLNLILIPNYSYIGAGIASISTQVACFIFAFYFLSKYLEMIPIHKYLIKPLIACVGMGFFIFSFQNINLFILIFMAIIVYFAIFLAIKGFDKADWEFLQRLIKRDS